MLQLKSRPALVIVDMQNGFCHENGTFGETAVSSFTKAIPRNIVLISIAAGKMGLSVAGLKAIISKIIRLRSACHQHHVPVFFARLGWNADYSDSGILLESPPASAVKDLAGFVRGTWDSSIIDELTPDPGNPNEIVFDKKRNSAFWGTGFAETLAERNIDQLIVTGVGTNVCVECTARDAFQNGIYTVTVSDATGTLTEEAHNATIETLQWFGGTATTAEVEVALRALQGGCSCLGCERRQKHNEKVVSS